MSSLQIRRAHALASAHGHEWAYLSVEVAQALWHLGAPRDGAREIARVVGAMRHDGGLAGVAAPAVLDDGCVVHTTGTGRLSWVVAPDGSTTITIDRPTGAVLRAILADEDILVYVLGGEFFTRHVEALEGAMLAVLAGEMPAADARACVSAALTEARAQATPEITVHCLGDVDCDLAGTDLDKLSPEAQVRAIREAAASGGVFFGAHFTHAVLALCNVVRGGFNAKHALVYAPDGRLIEVDEFGAFVDPWPAPGFNALYRTLVRGHIETAAASDPGAVIRARVGGAAEA